jgi:hypothetical protein
MEKYSDEEPELADDLKDRNFNHLLDQYLATASMDELEYNQLTPRQRDVIQAIKRAFKRLS